MAFVHFYADLFYRDFLTYLTVLCSVHFGMCPRFRQNNFTVIFSH